jgi:peptidoglycan/LPS O-acetylase OafA/YrhL
LSTQSPATSRLGFLDLTKGILVILMVVYHSLNYTNQYHLGFRYLSFLPPSFILITGFLISYVYTARYRAGDRRLVYRLISRGAKLLLLFTALNIVAQFVRSPVYGRSIGVATFFASWDRIYFLGTESAAVFEVLLPIAYLLLLAPALIWLAQIHRLALPVLTLCVMSICAFLDYRGLSFLNLNFISAGVIGMMGGRLIPQPAILGRYVWIAMVANIAYFPISITKGYVYLVQLFGACVVLAFICGLSSRFTGREWIQQRIIRLGQYSLLSYIAQIAILQTFSRFVGRPDPISVEALVLFLGTLLLTTVTVEIAHWARDRSDGAEKLYKAVFA